MAEEKRIPHYKVDRSTWSVEEILTYNGTGERRVNPEWEEARVAAMAAADLDDDELENLPVEWMDVGQRVRRFQKRGGRW
jgi:hypothetical protein